MDQNLVWKGGVILQREDTRAEVIEDYSRRKISVRIAGPDSGGLLAIVDDQLERIHRLFPRLKYEKFLPCNCETCRKRNEPFAYSLTELKDFALTGDSIQCRVSRKLVDAANLVREIFPTALYLAEQPRLFDTEECPPAQAQGRKEVFVSYAWTDESKEIVDQLEKPLSASGIALLRDKNELKYKDSIRNFMERIGRGKCIIVILSKRYLESKNCMFELTEIAARGEIRDRVFPIVLKDANIYNGAGRLDHIAHWEKQINELDSKMKTVSGQFLNGIREELDLFVKIRNTIAGIVETLGDMNALTPDQHLGANFQELLCKLEARLAA